MIWNDQGFIIGRRPLGEKSWIVDMLTHDHGRHSGLYVGSGQSLFAGAKIFIQWQARLEEQLGKIKLEPLPIPALWTIYNHPILLRFLQMMCIVCLDIIPHRYPVCTFYLLFDNALKGLVGQGPLLAYAEFENLLINELGYGINMDQITGLSASNILEKLIERPELKQHWPQAQNLHKHRIDFLRWLEKKI